MSVRAIDRPEERVVRDARDAQAGHAEPEEEDDQRSRARRGRRRRRPSRGRGTARRRDPAGCAGRRRAGRAGGSAPRRSGTAGRSSRTPSTRLGRLSQKISPSRNVVWTSGQFGALTMTQAEPAEDDDRADDGDRGRPPGARPVARDERAGRTGGIGGRAEARRLSPAGLAVRSWRRWLPRLRREDRC